MQGTLVRPSSHTFFSGDLYTVLNEQIPSFSFIYAIYASAISHYTFANSISGLLYAGSDRIWGYVHHEYL